MKTLASFSIFNTVLSLMGFGFIFYQCNYAPSQAAHAVYRLNDKLDENRQLMIEAFLCMEKNMNKHHQTLFDSFFNSISVLANSQDNIIENQVQEDEKFVESLKLIRSWFETLQNNVETCQYNILKNIR